MASVQCVTLMPKFLKMMDQACFITFPIEVIVTRIIQDVLELTLYCYHDVFRSGYTSPPENRFVVGVIVGSLLSSFLMSDR